MNFYEILDSMTLEQLREYYVNKDLDKENVIKQYLNLKKTFSNMQPLQNMANSASQIAAAASMLQCKSSQEKEVQEQQQLNNELRNQLDSLTQQLNELTVLQNMVALYGSVNNKETSYTAKAEIRYQALRDELNNLNVQLANYQ